MNSWLIRVRRSLDLYRLAAISNTGHFFWILPFVPLGWVGIQHLIEYYGVVQPRGMESVQGTLIGLPLTVLAIFLGLRIIAGEINTRQLEIVYTVPGGASRVWLTKMIAAFLILLPAELMMGVYVWFLITEYPFLMLQGAMQSALFYLCLAMGFGALFKSEVAGAIATVAIFGLNGMMTGFGGQQFRLSPFFNPWALPNADPADLVAWTIQNRIGFLLLTLALIALAFMRSNRREKLLSA